MIASDLEQVDVVGLGTSGVAVGWLAADRAYTRGEVEPESFFALAALLRNPWSPAVLAGRYPCPFCRFTGGPWSMHVDGSAITLGTGLVFVPSESRIFVAPSMILHYIDAHGYAPPPEFLAAVRACPPMRSMEYLKRLRALGVSLRPAPPTSGSDTTS
jgi:hypothetical protein